MGIFNARASSTDVPVLLLNQAIRATQTCISCYFSVLFGGGGGRDKIGYKDGLSRAVGSWEGSKPLDFLRDS